MLSAGDGQVADHVEAVATADGPAGNDGDDDLGHETDEALGLKDVQATQAGLIHRRWRAVVVGAVEFVAVLAAHPLVAAGAEGPAAVFLGRTVAGDEHAADVALHASVVEVRDEFVDGVGTKGVAALGPIKGDAQRALGPSAVVGDVGEGKAGHLVPGVGVEDV